MMWIIFALSSAVLEAFTSLFRKQATKGQKNFHLIPLLSVAISFPVVAVFGVYFLLTEPQNFTVYGLELIAANAVLVTIALWLRYKAVKIGDISLIEPLTMLLPAILLLTSWIILHESPSLGGIAGVLLVAFGAVFINTSGRRVGFFDPILGVFRSRANRLMLGVILIWSITANLDKLVVKDLSPPVYVMLLHASIVGLLWAVYRPPAKQLKSLMRDKGWYITAVGVLASLAFILQVFAIQSSFVSYALAIKRLDILLVVYLGYSVLKEHNFIRRALGTMIMLAGVVLILLVG